LNPGTQNENPEREPRTPEREPRTPNPEPRTPNPEPGTIAAMLPTIAREDDVVVMIDQRKLPTEEVYVRCRTAPEVARAIKTMVIRGAPAIGVAAAMGIAVGMRKSKATGTQKFAAEFHKICELMAGTRPTAVNLFWAIERMKRAFAETAQAGSSVGQIKDRLDAEARAIHDADRASCRARGAFRAGGGPGDGGCGRCPGADALQRRRARDRRLRHRARRHSRRSRARQEGRGVRGRNAAVSAGRALDGVGARPRRDRHHDHHRQHERRAHA